MKTNPLRLPLYILYTLKQVKIFRSRRIKSTVCCSLESNATLLPGDYKTVNYFNKTTEWKNGAILCQKVAHSTKLLRCSRALGVWLYSINVWSGDGRPEAQACEPSGADNFAELLYLYIPLSGPETSLHTIYKSFGQTLYYSLHVTVQSGECDWEGNAFIIFLPGEEWILGESWYRGLSAPLRMLSSSRTASRAQDLRSNIQSGERLWPVLNPHLANLIMSPDAQRKHSSQCAIRMYFQDDHLTDFLLAKARRMEK